MTYKEFIQNIINTRGQWNEDVRLSGACHRHHIKPVCMGGDKKKNWDHLDNIIWLYFDEHVKAHELLAVENPENEKLLYAWYKLTNYGKINICNNELYIKAKTIAIEKTAAKLRGRKRPNISGWHYYNDGSIELHIKEGCEIPNNFKQGRLPISQEVKDKIGKGNKDKIMPEEAKKKISIALTGRSLSNITKSKIGDYQKGNKNIRGRKWYTDGKNDKLLYECPQGWHLGRTNHKKRKTGN